MMPREIPIYLFTGFLEAGKTTFIQGTLEDPRFNAGENITLLVCEEGEVEYDPSRFSGKRVHVEQIDSERRINKVNLERLSAKYPTEMIVIEYNGMWSLNTLFEAMPDNWVIYQEISLADAGTFLSYNANMRQQTYNKLATCETIVFNRYRDTIDKMELHKIVRAANKRAAIIYEYPDGEVEYDEIEDPLPFDVNAPVIEIKDDDYAVWYRDMGENPDVYDGKTVRFKGVTGTSELLKDGFVIGRQVMTCCVEDIQMAGLACRGAEKQPAKGSWIMLTAKVSMEKVKIYGNKTGPVMNVQSIEKAAPPVQEVATFY